jgi:hypothetical protein
MTAEPQPQIAEGHVGVGPSTRAYIIGLLVASIGVALLLAAAPVVLMCRPSANAYVKTPTD